MAIYLFLQILKFTKYSIKLIEKLSRQHLINSSDVFVIKGFTVVKLFIKGGNHLRFVEKKNLHVFRFSNFDCKKKY